MGCINYIDNCTNIYTVFTYKTRSRIKEKIIIYHLLRFIFFWERCFLLFFSWIDFFPVWFLDLDKGFIFFFFLALSFSDSELDDSENSKHVKQSVLKPLKVAKLYLSGPADWLWDRKTSFFSFQGSLLNWTYLRLSNVDLLWCSCTYRILYEEVNHYNDNLDAEWRGQVAQNSRRIHIHDTGLWEIQWHTKH